MLGTIERSRLITAMACPGTLVPMLNQLLDFKCAQLIILLTCLPALIDASTSKGKLPLRFAQFVLLALLNSLNSSKVVDSCALLSAVKSNYSSPKKFRACFIDQLNFSD